MSKLKKIKTELIYDDSLNSISHYSDQVRMKQILLNFISNSVKFTNEGFINLIFKNEADKKSIKITVKDSGFGLKDIDKKLLFKEFYKNENTKVNNLNNTNVGSGLGLAICKNIADKLNMKIAMESEYGKGTEMSLIIFLNDIKNSKNNITTSQANNSYSYINSNESNIGSFRSKIRKSSFVDIKIPENDSNSFVNDEKNVKNCNNQLSISILDSYFQEMENNNLENFDNQNQTERFFNENILDNLSSKESKIKGGLFQSHTVIDKEMSKVILTYLYMLLNCGHIILLKFIKIFVFNKNDFVKCIIELS